MKGDRNDTMCFRLAVLILVYYIVVSVAEDIQAVKFLLELEIELSDIISSLYYEIVETAAMLVASHACSRDMPSEEQLLEFIRREKAEYGTMVSCL